MESAEERRARLRALREEAAQAARQEDEAQPPEPAEEPTAREPELKFRNYVVKNEKLEHVVVRCHPIGRLLRSFFAREAAR